MVYDTAKCHAETYFSGNGFFRLSVIINFINYKVTENKPKHKIMSKKMLTRCFYWRNIYLTQKAPYSSPL